MAKLTDMVMVMMMVVDVADFYIHFSPSVFSNQGGHVDLLLFLLSLPSAPLMVRKLNKTIE